MQLIETFEVISERGSGVKIYVYQHQVHSRNLVGQVHQIGGIKELKLSDGTPVNYVDESTYKNAQTGETFKRILAA